MAAFLGALGGGLLSGVGSIVSSVINANQSARNVADVNRANAALSSDQEQWARQDEAMSYAQQLQMQDRTQSLNVQNMNAGFNQQNQLYDRSQAFAEAQTAEQERYNTSEREASQAFNAQQANTVYQRGVNDMRAAGINPMLAIMKGGDPNASVSAASVSPMGASPTGASFASSGTPGAPSVRTAGMIPAQQRQNVPFGNFLSSAVEGAQMGASMAGAQAALDKTKADTDLAKASTKFQNQQTLFSAAGTGKAQAEELEARARAGQVDPSAKAAQQRDMAQAGASNAAAAASMANAAATEAESKWRLTPTDPTKPSVPGYAGQDSRARLAGDAASTLNDAYNAFVQSGRDVNSKAGIALKGLLDFMSSNRGTPLNSPTLPNPTTPYSP